jgi:formate hydrogenlyase subunit 3/multisubunit Na+/H+ antiporter MnhD subunit
VLYAALVTRAIGLILIAIATAVIQESAGYDALNRIRGLAGQQPFALIALLSGGITLAGLPVAANFPVHWLLLHDLARVDGRAVWIVALGGLGVAIFYVRSAHAMMQPTLSGHRRPRAEVGWPTTLLLLLLTAATVGVGLFPGPLLRAAAALVRLYPLPHL